MCDYTAGRCYLYRAAEMFCSTNLFSYLGTGVQDGSAIPVR